MKKWLTILFCLACALGLVSNAFAMTLSPLDSNYSYEKAFGDSGFTFMIPFPYTKISTIAQEKSLVQMVFLTEDATEAPFFVIGGIKLDAPPETIAELDPQILAPLFTKIVDDYSGYQTEIVGSFYEGTPVMLLTFGDDVFGQHTIVLRDGWLLVLSAFPGSLERDLTVMDEPLDKVLISMLDSYDSLPEVTTITLDGTSLSLVLPDGMSAIVDRYDEYDDDDFVIYFLHEVTNDTAVMNIMLTTIQNKEYDGQLLHELPMDELNSVAGRILLGYDNITVDWVNVAGYPILKICEVGDTFEDHKNSDIYHLAAMRDGWFFATTYIAHEGWPHEEMLNFQMSCMNRLLEGDNQPPTSDPGSISHQTLNGMLEMQVPPGFAVERTELDDTTDQYTIYSLKESGKAYTLTFETLETYLGLTVDNQEASVMAFAKLLEDQSGEAISTERIEDGYLGEPTLILSTPFQSITIANFIKDGCFVHIGIQSHISPPTQEEMALLPDLLRFVDGAM